MKRHRFMDLQPPPPPLFRHQYHHHHHLRYEHVLLHPPSFIPQHTHNHFPPPPPPPQLCQSRIILSPPPLHIAQPPRINQPPHRSHSYEVDLLPNPYPNCNFLPPPPPENIDRQFHPGENNRGRNNGINDCGRDYVEKRCDRVMKKMDYDLKRRGSIDGWIRGLYKDNDKYRDYDERRRRSSGIISEKQFVRSIKKRRLQKETPMSRVQSGKDDCSRNKGGDEESSGGSLLRVEEKEEFECLETRIDDKRASEAILASPCSDDVKTDVNSTIVETGITSSMPGSPTTTKSDEAVVKAAVLLADDALGTSKELLDKVVVPESGTVVGDANGSSEIDVKVQFHKDMKLQQGLTVVESGRARRNRLKRERKAREKLLRETDMQMGKDSGNITNADDCIIIPSASSPPQPCSNANGDLVEIAVKNQPQKDTTLYDCPAVCASQSARRKKRKARKKLLQETSLHMRNDSCHIANPNNPNNECSLGFNEHGADVKDQSHKDMNLQQDPTVVEPGSTRRNRLKRARKARKKLLHETEMQMRKDSVDITNADDCVIIPFASSPPQPCSDANVGLVEIAVENQPQKDTDLHGCPVVRVTQSARRKKWKARKKLLQEASLQMRNDSCHIANPNNECSLGFNQHGADVVKFVPKEAPVVYDTEKSRIESVDQYAKLGTDRVVDDIGEHPLHNMLPLEESSFLKGPSKVVVSLEGNDIAGSSQENRHVSSECDRALLLKLENVNIFDVGSADDNSKEVLPESVIIPDYSSVISTSTNFLAADDKGVCDTCSPNALSKKPSTGDIGSVGGSLEAINNDKTFVSADNSPNINSKRKAPGEVERLFSKDLVPTAEVDFISFKEVYNSNEELSRVEDPTLELDADANGYFPSYSKKRKVARPRSNLSSVLEDEMVADGLNGDCPKLCQMSTRLAEWEAEKSDDSSFSRNIAANEMICGGENISNRKPVSPDLSLASSDKSLLKTASDNSQINTRLSCSLPKANSEVPKKLNPVQKKQTLSKNHLISASPKVFPGHHPLYFGNSKKPQATNVVKSRTWHRTDNSYSVAVAGTKSPPSLLPPQSHGTKTAQSFRSSYIRKGNSLVRNHSPSAVKSGFHKLSSSVYKLNPGILNIKTNLESDTHASSLLRTEFGNTSEMPCKAMDASEERIKPPGVVSECRADSSNITTSPSTLEEVNSEKKIIYVKRRSNQLVAASKSDDVPVSGADKNPASASDGYYKSNKNQLVRASSENPFKKSDVNVNSRRLVPRTILPRTCTKRPSKLSFVWKLHDMHSSEKKASVRPQKVLPHVVPWKRTTYWRNFMHALSTKPKKSSFSIASQSLLHSRKRGAIYTRSTRGYSLKMSKVLSVGGSSLKWSKSIERNLKKADEEATRAVAAAGERKKEENDAVRSRNNVSRKSVLSIKLHPGERIFRIGSERYKMDPSRRTLHRITAEQEPPASVVDKSEKNVKRSYVPRRLLIGNEEYVRIGNGNKLVRDPKKRTRVLASEKVRWSLRTARLRLARKRKYCQFLTRFGKCNKDDGKCPYIHDPSKIAVCTKFLNGLCANVDCKLTHKVIPERMEDCSYFLKGSCSNEKCPYRHVNVNSESGVCKNFLRGYCADGNECLKKHTYVCPSFEATGSCPKASTCKLHHPKKKIEKKQPAIEQKIVKGRYFDGGLIGDSDVCSNLTTEVVFAKGNEDVVSRDGKFPDYISLDVSDEEDSEDMDDMVSDDFDVLV